MKDINVLLETLFTYDLSNREIHYTDKIDDEGIDERIGENYWLWKYYSGDISREEHEAHKHRISNESIRKIYDSIFAGNAACLHKDACEEIKACLAELWIIRPRENFFFEKDFKRLIFYTYVQTKDNCFRDVALEYEKENPEECTELVKDNELFLINHETHPDYNARYGVEVLEDESIG